MKHIAIKNIALARVALIAGLLLSAGAHAAAYDYTAHYDYVRKPALADAELDPQLQQDTVTCDGIAGVQRAVPSAAYRGCMSQRGWKYRFVSRTRIRAPAQSSDANFSADVKLQPGHYIDHDNGMDCQDFGGAAVCVPPSGTVHYYDPDQGLPCTRTGLVAVCSNF